MIVRFLAKRRWVRALDAACAHRKLPGCRWNVRVQIMLDQRAERLGQIYALTL